MVECLKVFGHAGFFRLRWHWTVAGDVGGTAMDVPKSTMTHQIAQAAIAFEQQRTDNHVPKSVAVRSQRTIGQRIAWAARAREKRRTMHGRNWVAVFMNEEPIVIALHGSLTVAERALVRSPAGAAQVREFHWQVFGNASADLLPKIKSLTGMAVRDTTAEIEPTTGHVVQNFTTDTVGRSSCSLQADRPGPGHGDTVRPAGAKVAPAVKPTKPEV